MQVAQSLSFNVLGNVLFQISLVSIQSKNSDNYPLIWQEINNTRLQHTL